MDQLVQIGTIPLGAPELMIRPKRSNSVQTNLVRLLRQFDWQVPVPVKKPLPADESSGAQASIPSSTTPSLEIKTATLRHVHVNYKMKERNTNQEWNYRGVLVDILLQWPVSM